MHFADWLMRDADANTMQFVTLTLHSLLCPPKKNGTPEKRCQKERNDKTLVFMHVHDMLVHIK
jgi:hypothetical protein